MANSTVGQLCVVGTPAALANKSTGAEAIGGWGRSLTPLATSAFNGVQKLYGTTKNGGVPVSRILLLLAQSDPRTVLGYKISDPVTGQYAFTNLPSAPFIVVKLNSNNIEQAQVQDWEIPNLP
jgi:hypothetical protein